MISPQQTSLVTSCCSIRSKDGFCYFELDLYLPYVDLSLRFKRFLPMLLRCWTQKPTQVWKWISGNGSSRIDCSRIRRPDSWRTAMKVQVSWTKSRVKCFLSIRTLFSLDWNANTEINWHQIVLLYQPYETELSTNFCLFKIDLSGNTVWPQTSDFQNLVKIDHFWHLSTQHINLAGFARNVEWDFLWISNTVL